MLEKEFAAGSLVYRKKTIYPYMVFLLVYSGRNKIWGFPKGHLEPGEDEEAAARRELAEETGITNPVFIKGFRQEDAYRTLSTRPGREGTLIEKHCVYFLCRSDSEDVLVDGLEITDYRWLDAIEAEKLIAFAGLKEILKKAFIFLEPRKTYK